MSYNKLKKQADTLQLRFEKIREKLNEVQEKALATKMRWLIKNGTKLFENLHWHPSVGYGGTVDLTAYFIDHSDGLCLAKAEEFPKLCEAFDLDPEEAKYAHHRLTLRFDGYQGQIDIRFDDNYIRLDFHVSEDSALFVKNFKLKIAKTFMDAEINRKQEELDKLIAFRDQYE
jgi:hypothetical protein